MAPALQFCVKAKTMVQLMSGLKPNVAGFEFTGDITREDYDSVIFPEVKKITEQFDELNVIFLIHTDIKNFSAGAWMQDAYLGLKNLTKWHRMALISDTDFVHKTTPILDKMAPGEFKAFLEREKEEAISWVSA